jgi:nitroreductase
MVAKAAYILFKRNLLLLLSIWGGFSSIYYGVFSPSYRREQRAVLSGLLTHMSTLKAEASFFLLRRNVHRIEKGLVTPNRRPLFAVEYIGETVEYYGKCLRRCAPEDLPPEMDWATSVLDLYFSSVASHPVADAARAEFLALRSKSGCDAEPYPRGNPVASVGPAALRSLALQRKSIRNFLDKPVPRELVDQALEIAALSPTSCNRQPIHYRIVDQQPLLKEMAACPLGAVSFKDNIPMICALTGDLSAYFYERDRHSIYVDGSLSAMLFMLALETVGLSSCPLNWAEIDRLDRRFETLAGVPSHQRVIMFIAIGYANPEGLVAYSAKKSLDLLRSYNRTGPNPRLEDSRAGLAVPEGTKA